MKYLSVFVFGCAVACGSGTTDGDAGLDAGADGSTKDAMWQTDGAMNNDAASSDSGATGDGGLTAGEICDPNNNECATGLMCCSEPTHMVDAATAFFCEKPVNKGCPLNP